KLDPVFPAGTSTVNNAAVIQSSAVAPTSSNTASTTVYAAPILHLTKTGPASASPNGTITYALSYKNTGSADAAGVTITDSLPPHVTYLSSAPSGTLSRTTLTSTVASLPALTASGSISATVKVDAPSTDPRPY